MVYTYYGHEVTEEVFMPWQEVSAISLRQEFTLMASREAANVRELCRRFGSVRPRYCSGSSVHQCVRLDHLDGYAGSSGVALPLRRNPSPIVRIEAY